jgi:hypothetical protein
MDCIYPCRALLAMSALLTSGVLIFSAGCRGDLAATNRGKASDHQTAVEPVKPPAMDLILPEETELERSIREQFSRAIEQDSALKDRDINFVIDNGDVSVTGHVRTESERQRINELALAIPQVKSIANALRVSD